MYKKKYYIVTKLCLLRAGRPQHDPKMAVSSRCRWRPTDVMFNSLLRVHSFTYNEQRGTKYLVTRQSHENNQ